MQKLTLTSKVKFLESKYKKAVGKYLNQELKQKDLTYIEFVLVSSGINENFDGYPKQRIAEVYKTPIHKPIDCYHLLQEEESYIRDPLGLLPSPSRGGELYKRSSRTLSAQQSFVQQCKYNHRLYCRQHSRR